MLVSRLSSKSRNSFSNVSFSYSEDEKNFLIKLYKHINNGRNIRSFPGVNRYKEFLKTLNLLTDKPMLYILNIDEKTSKKKIDEVKSSINDHDCNTIEISIKQNDNNIIEENNVVLNKLVKETYKMLDLITFFSAGKKEIKAWSIKKGMNILEAAKKIHSDIKRGFIKGEVISYDNFIKYKGEHNVKVAGKCKIEGKKYIVQDGDMINFKFNV